MKAITTPEDIKREAEQEVKQAFRKVSQPGQVGYVISTPARLAYDKDGNPDHLTEEAPHLHIQPNMFLDENGEPVLVEGGEIKMFQGRGVTFNPHWAKWVRDYFGYQVEQVDENGTVNGFSIEESRVLSMYEAASAKK